MRPRDITATIKDSNGRTCGCGMIWGRKQVVTCAHVLNKSLGRDETEIGTPTDWCLVRVVLPNGNETTGKVVTWEPPVINNNSISRDWAIVEVSDTGMDTDYKLVTMQTCAPKVSLFGYPNGYPHGRSAVALVGERIPESKRWELTPDIDHENIPVEGFSGAPVVVGGWGVAGLFSNIRGDASRGYMIEIGAVLETGASPLVADDVGGTNYWVGLAKAVKALDLRKWHFNTFAKRVDDLREARLIASGDVSALDKGENLSTERLLQKIQSDHRMQNLLFAPGGSGKTGFLVDLFGVCARDGIFPFWLKLSELQNKDLPKETDKAQAEIWNTCTLGGGLDDLAGRRKLIIADGLNEQKDATRVVECLKSLAQMKGAWLIITDRLRNVDRFDCSLYTIAPLPANEIVQITGRIHGNNEWLTSPFFLSVYADAIKSRATSQAESRDGILGRFFSKHVFNEAVPFPKDRLAEGAFSIYKKYGQTKATEEIWLRECDSLGKEYFDRMVEAGCMIHTGHDNEELTFRHQLMHDWLAACYFTLLHSEHWNNANFQAITLRRASLDPFDLSLEIVSNKLVVDFLQRSYDWDWTVPLNAIIQEAKTRADASRIPIDFRDRLFSLNALRLFDKFSHTQMAIKPLLSDYSELSDAMELTACNSVQDVQSLVEDRFKNDLSRDVVLWKTEFLKKSSPSVDEKELLGNIDPVLAWTVSNIMRVNKIDDRFASLIIQDYETLYALCARLDYQIKYPNEINSLIQRAEGWRWRIVHVLGVHSSHSVMDFLEKVLFNKCEASRFVRYGAARSLMETAIEMPSNDRSAFITRLSGRLNLLDPYPAQELCKACIVAPGLFISEPVEWYTSCMELLKAGRQHFKAEEEAWGRQLEACKKLAERKV